MTSSLKKKIEKAAEGKATVFNKWELPFVIQRWQDEADKTKDSQHKAGALVNVAFYKEKLSQLKDGGFFLQPGW